MKRLSHRCRSQVLLTRANSKEIIDVASYRAMPDLHLLVGNDVACALCWMTGSRKGGVLYSQLPYRCGWKKGQSLLRDPNGTASTQARTTYFTYAKRRARHPIHSPGHMDAILTAMEINWHCSLTLIIWQQSALTLLIYQPKSLRLPKALQVCGLFQRQGRHFHWFG